MGDKTGIEWTEATWNPVVGCSITSPGCTNCYAMGEAARLERMGAAKYEGLTKPSKAGPVWTGAVRLHDAALDQPLRWERPRRIFVNSMSDLFHEDMPDEAIDRVFVVMALAGQHTFQVLTKRSARMRAYMANFSWRRAVESCRGPDGVSVIPRYTIYELRGTFGLRLRFPSEPDRSAWPLPNVWLGVSVEDQRRADGRIPDLLATPAAVRFLSMEPLLGPVTLGRSTGEYLGLPIHQNPSDDSWHQYGHSGPHLDWVIVGGESGKGARPMHPDWVRSLRDQCAAAGVAFHFKQWGSWFPFYDRDRDDPDWRRVPQEVPGKVERTNLEGGTGFHGERVVYFRHGSKKANGRDLDGRTHDEFPGVRP